MSLDAMRWAWMQQDITVTQKIILLSLADRADEKNRCWPSVKRLLMDTSIGSQRTIIDGLRALESKGLIAITHSNGYKSNIYTLIGVENREYCNNTAKSDTVKNNPAKNGTVQGDNPAKNDTVKSDTVKSDPAKNGTVQGDNPAKNGTVQGDNPAENDTVKSDTVKSDPVKNDSRTLPKMTVITLPKVTPESTILTDQETKGLSGSDFAVAGPTQIVFQLPFLNSKKNQETFKVTDELFIAWSEAYPLVDCLQELKKIKSWLLSNPGKNPIKAAMSSFIDAWLKDEHNKLARHSARLSTRPSEQTCESTRTSCLEIKPVAENAKTDEEWRRSAIISTMMRKCLGKPVGKATDFFDSAKTWEEREEIARQVLGENFAAHAKTRQAETSLSR